MGARILWALVGGFLVGVAVRSAFLISWPYAAFFFVLALCSFAVGGAQHRKELLVLGVALIALGTGILRMDASSLRVDPTLARYEGKHVSIEGVIAAEPDVRDSSVHLTIDVRSASSSSLASGRVLAFVPLHTDVAYGDRVRVSGVLRAPEPFASGLGRQFDYPSYLAKDGIVYEIAFAEAERTSGWDGNILVASALAVKQWYVRGIRAVLPEPQAGLAAGITVGDKRSIGAELSERFQRASLIHIVVLSGYNITVVINAVAHLVSWLPRAASLGMSGLVVAFFIVMTGGAASAARAGLMALIASYARMSGRVFIAARALGVAAFCMVAWNPLLLAFDPSFQLSALATVGLVAFTPLFSRWVTWVPEWAGMREIAASTLATQSAVLPLLLYQNGALSLFALPANLLALAPMPLAMASSVVAAGGGVVLGSYGAPLALPAYAVLSYIIGVATFFSSLPLSSVAIPAFGLQWLLFVYAAMAAFLYKKDRPRHEVEAVR